MQIDYRSRTPVYEQIKEQILEQINDGVLKPDDQLPSIRQLATELSLNVNTVKRAFSELEAERVTYSVPGKGVFVSENAIANTIVRENTARELRRVIASARAKGFPKEEIERMVSELFEGGMKDD